MIGIGAALITLALAASGPIETAFGPVVLYAVGILDAAASIVTWPLMSLIAASFALIYSPLSGIAVVAA